MRKGSRLNLSLFGCASDNQAWQMAVNSSGASNAWVLLVECTCSRLYYGIRDFTTENRYEVEHEDSKERKVLQAFCLAAEKNLSVWANKDFRREKEIILFQEGARRYPVLGRTQCFLCEINYSSNHASSTRAKPFDRLFPTSFSSAENVFIFHFFWCKNIPVLSNWIRCIPNPYQTYQRGCFVLMSLSTRLPETL